MSKREQSDDTINVPGIGDIQSPSSLREQNRDKHETDDVPVPPRCPVPGCNKKGFSTFTELRGHFGHVNDAAHRSYNLSINDYRDKV